MGISSLQYPTSYKLISAFGEKGISQLHFLLELLVKLKLFAIVYSSGMSNSNQPSVLEWFKQNYPKEYDLANDINTRMTRILGSIEMPNSDFKSAPIRLDVVRNDQDRSKLELLTNEFGIIFIGTMVRAIIDLLSVQFGGLSSSAIGNEILDKKMKEVITQYFVTQDLKKCPNCQTENRNDAKYCDHCGLKLEE